MLSRHAKCDMPWPIHPHCNSLPDDYRQYQQNLVSKVQGKDEQVYRIWLQDYYNLTKAELHHKENGNKRYQSKNTYLKKHCGVLYLQFHSNLGIGSAQSSKKTFYLLRNTAQHEITMLGSSHLENHLRPNRNSCKVLYLNSVCFRESVIRKLKSKNPVPKCFLLPLAVKLSHALGLWPKNTTGT